MGIERQLGNGRIDLQRFPLERFEIVQEERLRKIAPVRDDGIALPALPGFTHPGQAVGQGVHNGYEDPQIRGTAHNIQPDNGKYFPYKLKEQMDRAVQPARPIEQPTRQPAGIKKIH